MVEKKDAKKERKEREKGDSSSSDCSSPVFFAFFPLRLCVRFLFCLYRSIGSRMVVNSFSTRWSALMPSLGSPYLIALSHRFHTT